MSERIAVVKKSSLEGLGEGWGDECYAYVRPASYEDNKRLSELNVANMQSDEQVAYQLEVVESHFVSGKIKVFDGEKFTLDKMTVEDATVSVAIADRLYADIMGFDLDPKELRKGVLETSLQNSSLKTNETSTETTSSDEQK